MTTTTGKNDGHFKIIGMHLAFLIIFPVFLYQKYGYFETGKVFLVSSAIVISMAILACLSKRIEIIAKDWPNVFFFTFIGIIGCVAIFGYPIAWITQRL